LDIREPVPEAPKAPLPPYNGFGSLEDSAQSCTSLIPRAPRKDLYKLMNKDRVVLRFKCCFVDVGTSPLALSDADRYLSHYFLDTIVQEHLSNIGLIGKDDARPLIVPWMESTTTFFTVSCSNIC
jgi:EF-hand domain-containing protein 1